MIRHEKLKYIYQTFEQFDLPKRVTAAFYKTFNRPQIHSVFRKAVILPLSKKEIIIVLRTYYSKTRKDIIRSAEIMELIEEKRLKPE